MLASTFGKQCSLSACRPGSYYSTRYKKCYRYNGKANWSKARCKRAWILDKRKGVCFKRSCLSKRQLTALRSSQKSTLASSKVGSSKSDLLPNLKVVDYRGITAATRCHSKARLGSLEIIVLNAGKASAKAGWRVEFYNPNFPNWKYYVTVNKELGPNESTTVVADVYIQSMQIVRQNQSYLFYPNLDDLNQIVESDENDNKPSDAMTLYRPKSCG